MCKLTEQFMMLTLFLVRTLTSKRAGSHTDSSTENVTSQVKTESLIKKNVMKYRIIILLSITMSKP